MNLEWCQFSQVGCESFGGDGRRYADGLANDEALDGRILILFEPTSDGGNGKRRREGDSSSRATATRSVIARRCIRSPSAEEY